MSFLSKFGSVLAKIAVVATDVATGLPLFSVLFPQSGLTTANATKVESDITEVVGVITTAEGMITAISAPGAKTGPQKLAAAAPFVDKIFQQWLASGILGATKIKDQTKWNAAVTAITSGFADLLNALGE